MSDRGPHRNDERTVRCPVEGCDDELLARGIHLHVRQTDGGGHGPTGDVPDRISFEDLTTIGSEAVEMDYPEERDTDETARLCPYCFEVFAGQEGVRIHLGQVAGRKNHPRNPAADPVDFPEVVVDETGNVEELKYDWLEGTEAPDAPTISATRVYRYLATLLSEGHREEARRARDHLIGPEDPLLEDIDDLREKLRDDADSGDDTSGVN